MSTLTVNQFMINNGISDEDSSGDTLLRCLKYTAQKTDTAISQIGLLPPDVSSYAGLMSSFQSDINKLKGYNVVNVKEYGAVGDDIVDDTTSFRNAILALTNNSCLFIPRGIYKITGVLTIQNLDYINIRSENGIISSSVVDNGITLSIYNCKYLQTSGRLIITTNSTTPNGNSAIVMQLCNACNISNIIINGNFSYGMRLLEIQETSLYGLSNVITNCIILSCRIGVQFMGEYYNINNCTIRGSTTLVNKPLPNNIAGIENLKGNNNVDNCHINYCAIGIFVNGAGGGNPDHGKITNCNLNHNSHIGIFLKDLVYSMNIANNQIWGTSGDLYQTYAVPVAATAANVPFGIYLQNAKGVNIIGNTIARSPTNIGLDGWVSCSIVGNVFLGNAGVIYHMREYGEANSTYSRNAFNVITDNVFDTNTSNISIDRFTFFNTNNSCGYRFKNNRGADASSHIQYISTTGTYEIGCREDIIISTNIGVNPPQPTDPSSQSTNITVVAQLTGEEIKISFTDISNKWVWIRFRTNDTTTSFKILGNGLIHYPSLKALLINTGLASSIKLVPYGAGANQWACYSNV